ncbi:Phloem protein 2-like [Sesbania bispinosa]|nr:Phloem protein 2-like [Sesbania bispinosa]
MADSDPVWEKFLPFNYQGIVSKLVTPSSFPSSSKKELFVRLCKPQLIDDGDKDTDPIAVRFAEAAELRTICWLEIKGSIKSGMLSPKTLYKAYLKVKIADRAYGLDSLPSEVSIEVGNYKSQGTVYIRPTCRRNGKASCHCHCKPQDEWLEIELGSFFTQSDSDEEVRMCLKEVKGVHLKGGLIVDGIEIRPKHFQEASKHGP